MCAYSRCDEPGHGPLHLCPEHDYQAWWVLDAGLDIRVPCEWCGTATATVAHGLCRNCSAALPCDLCGAPRSSKSTTGMCRPCYIASGEEVRMGLAVGRNQHLRMEIAA